MSSPPSIPTRELRIAALHAAVKVSEINKMDRYRLTPEEVLTTATRFEAWLTRPMRLDIRDDESGT